MKSTCVFQGLACQLTKKKYYIWRCDELRDTCNKEDETATM